MFAAVCLGEHQPLCSAGDSGGDTQCVLGGHWRFGGCEKGASRIGAGECLLAHTHMLHQVLYNQQHVVGTTYTMWSENSDDLRLTRQVAD